MDWSKLQADVRVCKRCRLHKLRHLAVPGEPGSVNKLAFMATHPGMYEDATGRPFVGKTGELLDFATESAGILRSEVLVTNRVRCRPPRLADYPDALAECGYHTQREMETYDPLVVVLMGKEAIQPVFGNTTVGAARSRVRMTGPKFEWGSRAWVATYHPAAALPTRNPETLPLIIEDLVRAKELVEWLDSYS